MEDQNQSVNEGQELPTPSSECLAAPEAGDGQASVWAIEEGEYSDYRVVGVFSSEANANQVSDLIGGEVSQWLLDPAITELNQGLRIYRVQMQKDGTVDHCECQTFDSYAITTMGVSMWRRSQAPAYKGKGVQDVLSAKVWAKNATHAVKITNEHRAQFIASGRWGKDST